MMQRPAPTSDKTPCDLEGQGVLPFPTEDGTSLGLLSGVMLSLDHEAGKHTRRVKTCRECMA
jgi:hypothetical protein